MTRLKPDQITRIGRDIALGRPINPDYTGEEKIVYRRMKAEFEEFKKKNPHARLDVYGNIDGL